ncbi:hypothetical protein LSUE1_G009461, partial [Lachnellula suecica]
LERCYTSSVLKLGSMTPQYDDFLDDQRRDGSKSQTSTHIRHASKWLLELIRPAIITRAGPRKQVRPTAYLDGLRGVAAFLVYWQHHELWPLRSVPANRILENGFGYEGKYYFAALPVIRTMFTGGHFAVAVFFVISGYVLSAKPLSLMHAGKLEELGNNLSSALFRRWIRLHVPIILVTFLYMSSWHVFGIWVESPKQKSSFREEFWSWYSEFKNFSYVFRQGGDAWFTYNFPTWSIPVEFRGSIIIYTTLLAVSRSSRDARLWCQAALMFYFMYVVDGWYGAAFISGMLLCDLDLLAKNDNLPGFFSKLKEWEKPLLYGMLLISVILSGVPSHVNDLGILTGAPGWYYLAFLKPEAIWDLKWFYLCVAAVCFVTCVPRIWWLKAFFETSFNQYLGRISFSLYLVHGPILWTLGDRLYVAAGWYKESHELNIPGLVNLFPLSEAGPLGLEPRFLLPHLILLPLTLWISEMVTKLGDEPVVRFSQWLYTKSLAKPAESLKLLG